MPRQHFFYRTVTCPYCTGNSTRFTHRVRQDARVYLAGYPSTETVHESSGACVGAIWTARPLIADAGPRPWGPARPDKELEQVLELYARAYKAQTSAAPESGHYIKVLHLCHTPLDEDEDNSATPWACGYREGLSARETPPFLIAAWGTEHNGNTTAHARRTIHDQLLRQKWDTREVLFFVQDDPPCARVPDTDDRRPILPRPLEELVRPFAWGSPLFQARLDDLAKSLKASAISPYSEPEDVLELEE